MFIIDYLIVVALDEETGYTYEVLRRELGLNLKIQPADAAVVSAHAVVKLTGKSGPSEELLVVVSPGEMGHSAMAASLPAVIERWRPRDIILIGISGSVDPKSLLLGDVLVPMRVFGYAQAKVHFSEGADDWTFRTMGERTTGAVRTEMRTLMLDPALREAWERQCLEASKADPSVGPRVSRAPRLHIHENDVLGTGNFVVASSAFAALLRQKVSASINAVDMEAGGVFEAMAKIEWTSRICVIRGISDYADEEKSKLEAESKDGWRKYSMQNAVRLACLLVAQRPHWTDRASVSPPYDIRMERHNDTILLCDRALLINSGPAAFHMAYAPFLRRATGSPALTITVTVTGPGQTQTTMMIREQPTTTTEIVHRSVEPGRIVLKKDSTDQPYELEFLCSAPIGGANITITILDEFGRQVTRSVQYPRSEVAGNAV